MTGPVLFFGVVLAGAVVEYVAAAALARVARKTLWIGLATGLAVYGVLLWLRPPSLLLSGAAVLGVSALAGAGLGRIFRDRVVVIAYVVAAAMADLYSVYFGPAGELVANADRGPGTIRAYLTVAVPVDGAVVFVLGLGDLLFLAYIFTTLGHLRVAPLPRFAVPVAGLLAALAFGLATAGAAPGLPFMAATVVSYLLLATPSEEGAE